MSSGEGSSNSDNNQAINTPLLSPVSVKADGID